MVLKAVLGVCRSASSSSGRAWTAFAVPFLLALIGGIPSSEAEAQALTVQRFNFRGLGAGDSTYYLNEVVRVRVFFTQHVAVDMSGGEPYLDLTVGTATRRARYNSSRQNYLGFSYRVQAGDFDGDGVSVPANGLALNGALVTAKDNPAVVADPAHGAAEGGLSRKVDGSRARPQGPTLSAVGASVAEGGAGAETDLGFAVRLSPAAAARVTVEYADAGSGTATSGVDYAAVDGGTLTFEPGDTLRTVWVKVRGDDAVEDDETVVLALSGATGAELATRTVKGTIVNDDEAAPPPLTVQRIDFRAAPGGDSTYYRGEIVRVRVFFTQRIAVDASGGLPSVDLTVGTETRRAVMGSRSWNQNRLELRYTVQEGDFDGDGVSVQANGLALNGALVTAQNDASVRAETAHAGVEGGAAHRVDGSRARPQGPTLSAVGASVAEGGAGTETDLGFAVRLSPAAAARVTVEYADAGSGTATSGVDYAAVDGGTLTFEPGDTLRTVWVKVRGDDAVEDDETVVLALSGATGAELATRTVAGTIVNDDEAAPPALTVQRFNFRGLGAGDSTYYLNEVVRVRVFFTQHVAVDASGGEPYLELRVGTATRRARYNSSRQNYLGFSYRVQAGDFDGDGVSVPANGLALNGALVTAKDNPAVVADPAHGAAEGGLSRKVDGSRARPQGPTLSAVGASVAEGGAGTETDLGFAVRLSPSSSRVTVEYADAGSGTATSGVDYAAVEGGTLTFEPGDTLRTVWVKVRGDDAVEDDETVVLALSGATGAELATRTVAGTIVNDDEAAPPALTVQRFNFRGLGAGDSTYYLNEVVRVRVFFTQHVAVDMSGGEPYLDLTVGTATRRARYNSSRQNYLGFSYRVQAGDFDGDGVSVPANGLALNGALVTAKDNPAVVADPAHGAAEGGLSRKVDGSRARPQGPTLSAGGASVAEGGAGTETELEFDVWLGPPSSSRVTVEYADAGSGTATSGVDYAAVDGGTLTFEPGDTLRTVWVKVRGDDAVEDDETVVLALSGATGAELATRTVKGTIVNDDEAAPPPLTVQRIDFRAAPGGDSTYYRGEIVRVRVFFTQRIAVDASGGLPSVDLTVGTETRRAVMGSRSWNQNRLELRYTVQEGDFDGDGVSVQANGLALNGALVTAQNDASVRAETAHAGVEGGAAHRVDGSRARPQGPTLSAVGASVAEGGAGTETDLGFAVRLSPAAAARVTVEYADAGSGTATSGVDYAAVDGGTLTFEPGDTLRTVWVKVRGDDAVEDDETVVLALSGATGAELATRTVAGTIRDDDEAAPPALTVQRFNFRGLGAGDSTYYLNEVVRVRVFFTQHVAVDASGGEPYLDLRVGTATRRARYNSSRQNYLGFSYRVQAGDFDGDGVSVPANGLALNGALVTAKDNPAVVADPAHGAAEGGLSRKVDGSRARPQGPTLSAGGASVAEGGAGTETELEFDVWLGPPSSSRVTVEYADAGSGTATSGVDYAAVEGGTLTFEPGETLKTVRVTVRGDDAVEDDETVVLALSGATGAELATRTVKGTIRDDDEAPPALTVKRFNFRGLGAGDSTYYLNEVVRVRVFFTQHVAVDASGGEPYLDLRVGTATRRARYNSSRQNYLGFSYRVQAGDFDGDGVSVPANGLALNGALVTAKDNPAVVADPAHGAAEGGLSRKVDGSRARPQGPTLSAGGASVAEGGAGTETELEFDVWLGPPSSSRVTVEYADAGSGTATSGVDYAAVEGGTLTFEPGETLKTVRVTVRGDDAVEDDETVVLALSGATGAELATRTVKGTIRDDDGSRPRVSIDSLAVHEPGPGETVALSFAMSLSAPAARQVTVRYRDAGTGTATPGTDYDAVTPGSVVFAPGDTTQALEVTVRGDALDEPAETIVLALANPVNADLPNGYAAGVGTIEDDDDAPTLSAESPSVEEGNSGGRRLTFTLALDRPSGRGLALHYADAGTGTATSGADYEEVSPDTLFFEPGELRKSVDVMILGDTLQELDETVVLRLSSPDSTVLAVSEALITGSIRDDDGDDLVPSFGDALVSAQRWFRACEIRTLQLPPAEGGNPPLTYGLAPALPSGMKFDAERRTIAGTPRQEQPVSTYRYTATDEDGDSATLSFTAQVELADNCFLDRPDGPEADGDPLATDDAGSEAPSTVDDEDGEPKQETLSETDADSGLPTGPAVGAQSSALSVQRFNFRGLATSDSTYYRDEVVRVRVFFTQHVTVNTVGGKPYLDLTIGTTTRRAAYNSSRQNYLGFSYRVQAGDFDSDGVSVPANGLALNGARITAQNDTSAHANVAHDSATGGASRKVDGGKYRPPEVRGVTFSNSPASGDTYGYGEKIEATVAVSHRVLVTTTGGTPTLALTIGAHTRQATLTRAGRRTRLTFSYTVQAGDVAPAGASIAANALSLNGGAITHDADTATHAALAHGAIAADSTRKVNGRRGRPPKVEGIAFGTAPKDSVYWRGDTIAVRVGFDDSVAVIATGGSPQVALTIGTVTRQAMFSASNGKALEFAYVVQATDRDADGVSIAANALALNGATIRGTGAASGRDADVTHPLVKASVARTVDGSKVRAPAVRSVAFVGSAPYGGTYYYDTELRVEVVFDRSVVVDTARGSPRLALAVGAQRRHAAFAPSASTATTLMFAYRVQSADMDADGAGVDANALGLNGGAIKAEADSAVAANLTHDALAADPTRKVDGRPRITALEFYRPPRAPPPPPQGVYGYDERIWVLARFDQEMVLEQQALLSIEVGTDTLRLGSHSRLRMADSAVAFYYTVTRDAVDTDGLRIPKGVLTLSGGSLRAAADGVTNARLDHDGVRADSNRRVNGRLTPAPRPVVYFQGSPANGSTFTRHERIYIGVSYSAGVAVTGTPELTLNLGTGTRQLAAVGYRSRGLLFEHEVQPGDLDEDGISVSANTLSLPSGATIRSVADTSVVAVMTHDSVPASPSHKVDGRQVGAARVKATWIGPPPSADSTYTRDEVFYVYVDFDRNVAVDTTGGRPRIALGVGDSTRHATYRFTLTELPSRLGFEYVVQAGDRDADGIEIAANALELNGGSITAPDDTVAAELSHAAVRADSAYKVDGGRLDAPRVRWMGFDVDAPASGDTYLRGDLVLVTVAFDRDAALDTVGGRPRLALQVGDSTRYATYLGPPRTRTHHGFEYVVQATDRDADGLSVAANALELNGGTITAPGGTTAAVLTHDSVPTSAAHKVDGRQVGAAKVKATWIGPPPSADSTYTRDEVFYVYVDFDRNVAVDTVGGRPRIALGVGDSTRYATYGFTMLELPSRLGFEYVVQAGDRDADGIEIAANALELNGGSITAPDDTVAAELSHAAVRADSAYKVDGGRLDAPRVRWMGFDVDAPASGDTYLRGDLVLVTVAFDRDAALDTVGGRPRLALQVGDSTRYATYLGPPRTRTHHGFEYVVQATDRDADGLSVAANALELNGGTITAPGGTTAAVLTHDSVPASAAHKVDGSRTAGDAEPEENRAPEVASAIAPMTMEVASPAAVVDLSEHFRDPDGDELRYFSVSAAPRSVRADVAGSALTVDPLAVGESLVTVRAADPDGAEAEQSFMVTVEASRTDRARIMKRSLAAFGRAVGTGAVEAIGGRLGAADDNPGATGEAQLQVGGRTLSCVGAGERCDLRELARQATGVLGLRMSQGAGGLASALWAAANGSHDADALRGLAGPFGQPAEIGATTSLGSAADFGATVGKATGPGVPFARRPGGRAGWGRLVTVDPVSREELLGRSSFRFSPGADRQRSPAGWTFWGQAGAGGFKGRPEDDLVLDGTVRSAYLGADYRFGAGPLVGLALSRTTSSIGFESGINGTGAVDARLTSLHPYAQWSPRAGLNVWGLVGAGRGTAELSEDATGRDFATNIGMAMAAAGVRQRLTGALAVKADAFAVRTDADEARELAGVVANVQRLRLASEVGGRWSLSSGSAITSRVEVGARFDGGDAETGAGAEAGAGIGYVHDGIGLSVDARGRALVAHQASSFREWGASVAIRLRPSREAGGLSFTLEPTWGNAASGMAMLWRDGIGRGASGASLGASSASLAGGGPLAGGRANSSPGRLRMEMDYAIVLADGGRVAPFGRWAAESGSARRLNVGVRLSVLEAATLDLFGEQVSGGAEPTGRRLGLQGAVRFR